MQQRRWRQGWILTPPPQASLDWLTHVVTAGPLNFATNRGPHRRRAVELRRDLCRRLQLDFDRLTAARQVHGSEVLRVTARDQGAGRSGPDQALPLLDGLICDTPGVGLLLLSADCPLVVLADPSHRAIGVAHCGWRSLMAGICTRLVRQMNAEFDSDPAQLLAAVGPCPCPGHYPVGPEVVRIAAMRFGPSHQLFAGDPAARLFDLRAAVLVQLTAAGLPPGSIELARECTVADTRFFSHRRQGPDTGRFALIAAVR